MSNYIKINMCDTVNSLSGIAVSLWMSGCPHKCKDCFNKESWDRKNGTRLNIDVVNKTIEAMKKEDYSFFSVLGGEPLAPYNIKTTLYFLSRVKEELPHIKTMIWTGYKIEDLHTVDLTNIDFIMDGAFDSTKPTKKKLRGSDNQRLFKIAHPELTIEETD